MPRAVEARLCCHAAVHVESVQGLDDPRIAGFRDLKDTRATARAGLFVVEGRDNLRRLLEAPRFRTRSLLLTPTAFAALSQELESRELSAPVFVAARETLAEIAGFNIHRGCLALAERGAPTAPSDLLEGRPPLLLALEYVGNPDNMGGLFRNAMAFGVGGVLLCPRSGDPLYRKAIRTSMGGSLLVPFARCDDFAAGLLALREAGYRVVALDPGSDSVALGCELPATREPEGLVLLLGNEGEGLSDAALALADLRVRIPMVEGVDSLNVATASGIALHHFAGRIKAAAGAA